MTSLHKTITRVVATAAVALALAVAVGAGTAPGTPPQASDWPSGGSPTQDSLWDWT